MAVDHPDNVLARGEHAGHEWMVVHNGGGHRCGYAKVLPGHPWHGLEWDAVPADVHGGVTFAKADRPCALDGPDDGWWVGFDCAHSGDAADPALPRGLGRVRLTPEFGTVRTQAYVEAECRSLCEQAAATAIEADGIAR